MKKNKSFEKEKIKKIAKKRITELFSLSNLARKNKLLGKDFSNRYVYLARKIAMKSNVSIPKEQKLRLCKHCYKHLTPGDNCRVRLKNHMLIYYCLECKKFMKFPYIKEQKAKRTSKK
jgi:ribonuclease P protein subunit RPR2